MKITFLMPLIIILSACATTRPVSQLSTKEGAEIDAAARSGDFAKIRQLLNRKQDITEVDRFWIIYNATNGQCHTDVVRAVLEKKPTIFDTNITKSTVSTFGDRLKSIGDQLGPDTSRRKGIISPERPAAILISIAGKNFCDAAFKLISEKTSSEDFAMGLYLRQIDFNSNLAGQTSSSFLEHFERATLRDDETEESAARAVSLSKYAAERIKSDCAKFQGESCKAEVAFRKIVENMGKEQNNREYAASPEGTLVEICNSYAQMKDFLILIKEENERGKISGYVNKVALKQWGDSAFTHKKELEAHSSRYKSLTKKSPNPSVQCSP